MNPFRLHARMQKEIANVLLTLTGNKRHKVHQLYSLDVERNNDFCRSSPLNKPHKKIQAKTLISAKLFQKICFAYVRTCRHAPLTQHCPAARANSFHKRSPRLHAPVGSLLIPCSHTRRGLILNTGGSVTGRSG